MVLDERRSMIVQQGRDAEDAGLFKAGINKIVIDVIPELRRNNRKDLVVTGFVRGPADGVGDRGKQAYLGGA